MTHHEHPNVALVRQGFEAMDRGEMTWMEDHVTDDVVWHVAGRHRFSGDYRGRDAVLAYFDEMARETAGSLKLEPLEVIASDAHGAVFLRVSGDRDGKHLDAVMAEALTFDAQGRVTEFFAVANDQAAIDDFWS